MRTLARDATTALVHGVLAALNFEAAALEEVRSRSWASVTFSGARHELTLRLDGEGAEDAATAFLEGLDAAEFSLRGHILADIALVSEERTRSGEVPQVRLKLEALTVEDD